MIERRCGKAVVGDLVPQQIHKRHETVSMRRPMFL